MVRSLTTKNKYTSHTFSQAFTIVELLIVVAIISTLTTLGIVSYNTVQKSTRDTARDNQTTVIANALERYYDDNNEYPSVAFMVSQNVDLIKQKLKLTDSAVLKFPLASAATSIAASNPSSTQLVYSANTTDSSKNSQCQTDINGYCDAFQLQYVKETGEVVTKTSAHNTFVAIGNNQTPQTTINYSDDFTATGALGNVKTGSPTLAWQFLNSTSSNWARNSGGYATTTGTASSNPMAIADVGTADVSISEAPRATGSAIYFRVTDATNWLRARVDETQTSTYVPSGYYVTEYQYTAWCTYTGNGGGTISGYSPTWFQSTPSNGSAPVDPCASGQTAVTGQGWTATGSSRQTWIDTSGYTYTYAYNLILDKSVSGTITQLASASLGSSLPGYIKVVAKGSAITTSYGSTSSATSAGSSATDATNLSATKQGIGYAASTYGTPTGVKSIAITNAP